jgi:hypothetical protein
MSEAMCPESAAGDADDVARRQACAVDLVADALITLLIHERLAAQDALALQDRAAADAHPQTRVSPIQLAVTPRPMAVSTRRDERARQRGTR